MAEEVQEDMFAPVDGNGDPVELPDENSVRQIQDMVDFYQTIRYLKLEKSCQQITEFCSAFENLNKGCGCTRNTRVEHAKVLYLNVSKISPEVQLLLKDALGVEKVQFLDGAGLFAEF